MYIKVESKDYILDFAHRKIIVPWYYDALAWNYDDKMTKSLAQASQSHHTDAWENPDNLDDVHDDSVDIDGRSDLFVADNHDDHDLDVLQNYELLWLNQIFYADLQVHQKTQKIYSKA